MQLSKVLLTVSVWSACQLVHAAPQNVEAAPAAEASAAMIQPEFIGIDAVDAAVTADQQEAPPPSDYEFSTLGQMERRYRRYVRETLASRPRSAKCNSRNVILRKYWGAMKRRERIDYTRAVKCLYNRPSRSDRSIVPGARNRLDDFVAAHIQLSSDIHFNGYLFAWHRHFVYLYDQALRNECGYRGPTPYWDWTRHADDPRKSPVFDGSETSMGGNGEYYPHGATMLRAFGLTLPLPPGTGGGCVKQGPFTDLVVNLGLNPEILPAEGTTADAPLPRNETGRNEGALNYNPRCLTRDINPFWSDKTRRIDVEYLLNCPNVACLEQRADGWGDATQAPSNARFVEATDPQVHPAGHFAIGGLQNDPFASPGDPAFYLHHAQFDRVWAIWQGQDVKRVSEVGGPVLPFGGPTTPQVKREDTLRFGAVGGDLRLQDILSTIDGPYCYIYI